MVSISDVEYRIATLSGRSSYQDLQHQLQSFASLIKTMPQKLDIEQARHTLRSWSSMKSSTPHSPPPYLLYFSQQHLIPSAVSTILLSFFFVHSSSLPVKCKFRGTGIFVFAYTATYLAPRTRPSI